MRGRLFYLMGPSGAGKDSLLCRCRERLGGQPCLVAARYITRAPELQGENHLALSEAEFAQRVQLGAFALHWSANGHRYGIGVEIDQWLARGIDVLVNGSRGHLQQARERYGEQLVPLLLQVDPQVLERRLRARGRESAEQIAARVARAGRLAGEGLEDALLIDNNGDLDAALEQLLAAVTREPLRKERVGEC
jgi:ribose 1,5-bisphosphokinase